MPKSLVTGGAGFIGSHVTEHLILAGHEVVVLDDLSGGIKENVPQGAIFAHGNITNPTFVDALFDEHTFDYVYHLAAYAAEGLSHFVRSFNYQNNVIGSTNLINTSVRHDIKCFVFASSIAVYGKNQLPIHEEATPHPIDPYGIAKYAVELDLKAAHDMFGLNHIIFRPHNVYGERQNLHDPYRNVIGIFMNQILQRKPLTLFGNGSQTRAFSHVDDVAPQIARSIKIEKAYNDTFNIGADHPCTVLEIAENLKRMMQSDVPIEFLPGRHEVQHVHADHHKLRTVFHINQEDQIPLEVGLLRMIHWAKNSPQRTASILPDLEIEKNLPPSWKK